MSDINSHVGPDYESIPPNWEIKELHEIATRSTTTINPQAYRNEEFLVYSIPAYYENREPEIEKGAFILSQKLLVSDDTVLFGCLNPRVPKVWYVRSKENKRKISSTEFLALSTRDEIDSRFLFHLVWSKHVLGKSHQLVRGSTPSRERVDKSALLKLKVPVPPHPEQRAIAEILDIVARTITQTERLIEKLRAIKSGLLHDLLTRGIGEDGAVRDPEKHPKEFKDSEVGLIPKEWKVIRLVELFSFPEGQVDPRKDPYREMPLIAPDHIETKTGRLLAIRTAEEQGAISGKYSFQSDDILYSKIRPYLRKAVLATQSGLCSADMYPLRPNSNIVPRFLLAIILGEDFSRFAEAVSMRSGFPKINRAEMSEYSTAISKYKEQKRISKIFMEFDNRIEIEYQYLDKLEHLKRGLMHDLLTGRVRVKIPKERNGGP